MTSPITLCATNRLAQTYRSAAPDPVQDVWETPQAFALETWLDQLGDEAMLSGIVPAQVVLDAFSEKILWQRIIESSIDRDSAPLFDTAAMAARAADAYAMSTVWALELPWDGMSREATLFAQWRDSFRQQLSENGWTTAAERRDAVVRALEAGRLRVRSRVVFAGFDELTPLHERLRSALDAQLLRSAGDGEDDGARAVTTYEDVVAECRAIVRWAQAQLDAHPTCRIGIVVPDLNSVRDCLEYELDNVLHPECASPAFAEHPRCYNFSLGRALADTPIVACALQLLRLAASAEPVTQTELATLLHSPYWSDSVQEADARSVLDAHMRRWLSHRLGVADLLRLAQSLDKQVKAPCPMAIRHLTEFSKLTRDDEGVSRLPSEWAHRVRTLLRQSGWAGSAAQGCRALSSHEYQARQAWSELLDQFACADQMLGTLPFAQAVSHLHALCQERMFQPQTRGTPAVHVLGMLESTGLQFDALWVMGMHDGAWPPVPAPNPLMPVELQRAHGVPNSCASVQLSYARTILRRLQRQAPTVRFSCALMDGSQELRHSPLFGEAVASTNSDVATNIAAVMQGDLLDYLDDAAGPALGADERPRGGVALLRAQAICPAWAFYRYRLGAAALEEAQEGLGPQDRGTLVHDALECFWNEARSRQALADLAARPAALAQSIAKAVDASLHAFETRKAALPAGFRELEVLRLTLLLNEWLSMELKRVDFEVVECEREVQYTVGPIALTLRIDRIDRQEDKLVVIDYKTGSQVDTNNWASARITEPQLPIYALVLSGEQPAQQVGALAFGKVRPGESRFTGVSATPKFVAGVQGMHQVRNQCFAAFADWDALQTHWRERIAAIADEFACGHAGVIVNDDTNLDYCEVLPLLRLPEREALRTRLPAAGVPEGLPR
jgi:exodeoxyribonuclease-5